MKIVASVEITAPARAVWTVLGEGFGHIGQWAAPIEHSTLEGKPQVGAVRHCHIKAFGPVPTGVIQEQLLEFEPQTMHFSYHALAGLPSFVGKAQNHWSVKAVDAEHCIVITEASLELNGWMRMAAFMLKPRFQRSGEAVLQELKFFVETGQPHPRKQKANPAPTPQP